MPVSLQAAPDALCRFADVWDSLEIRNLVEQLLVDKNKAVMKIMMLPEVELEVHVNRLCAVAAV